MANELLDFVMSLVRDPEVAARYAVDPAAALSAANLTGVTSADVDNLLPMVSESLSMGSPLAGGAGDASGNVWTSGAATAAFDSFTPHHTVAAVSVTPPIDGGRWPHDTATHPPTFADHIVDSPDPGSYSQVTPLVEVQPIWADTPVDDDPSGWVAGDQPGVHDHHHGGHPGLDITD